MGCFSTIKSITPGINGVPGNWGEKSGGSQGLPGTGFLDYLRDTPKPIASTTAQAQPSSASSSGLCGGGNPMSSLGGMGGGAGGGMEGL